MKAKSILLRQLKIDPLRHKVISIVGAGGKTSLMRRLREEFVAEGRRVIVSTSTHIAYDPDEPFAEDGDADKIRELIGRYGYAVTGTIERKPGSQAEKLKSIGEGKLHDLLELCDVMLIEADGARHRFIKVPASHEPVIYPWTDLVIALTSAISIGRKIEEVAYREEELAEFLGKQTNDNLDASDIALIASSDAGLRKYVGDKDYRFYLNAMDDFNARQNALDDSMAKSADIKTLMNHLRSDCDIECHCGSLQHIDEMGAVILAAGLGTRFGGGKLEAEIAGRPMYRHVLDEMAEAFGYENITFVTNNGLSSEGHSSIADDVASTGAKVVINEHPEDGISSSMRLGLMANIHKGSCMFAVADQPFISSESISALVEGYMSSDRLMASMTDASGEFANPCIFSAAYYDDLMQIRGDRGGKSVIKKNAGDVYAYTPTDISELDDIDTKYDYENLRNNI